MRYKVGLVAVIAALLAPAAPAAAQGLGALGLGGLPTTIGPPNPLNSAETIYPGFDDCPGGEAGCPARVILEMYERWRPLNASCDHNAVFALTYLRTTEEFARTVAANASFFEDGPWVNHEDAVFAQLYFRAFDARFAGTQIPVAWTVAFDAAASPDVTGIGDLFLGMNAHINRDLSYTLAAVGLVKPGGGSRKTDHDKVNEFLARVADPLQNELARRYDPLFTATDTPTPLDESTVLEAVRGFREQAWRNAENHVNAPDATTRALAYASTEAQSEAYANSIRSANTLPGYGPTRDAYCRANLQPSFKVALLDTKSKRVAKRGTLRLSVYTDGPARVNLDATLARRAKRPKSKPAGAAKKRRGPFRFAQASRFETAAAGDHLVELPLTKRGRKALKRRRRAQVAVTLQAPGLGAQTSGQLRRPRRRR